MSVHIEVIIIRQKTNKICIYYDDYKCHERLHFITMIVSAT